MRRFTIGRLMLVVAAAALLLATVRAAGAVPGASIVAWLALGWFAWAVCRDEPACAMSWATLQGFVVGVLAVGFGALGGPGAGPLVAALLCLFGFPITLGCGLGWRSAIRRANRTAPVRRSTVPAWASILVPAAVIVGYLVSSNMAPGR